MKKVERAIQWDLVDWVGKTYKQIMLQATLNEDSRYNLRMGVCVGITDIIIFLRHPIENITHILFLELKTKNKRSVVRDTQTDWYNDCYVGKVQAKNTVYVVAYGRSEAQAEVTKFFSKIMIDGTLSTVYST